MDHTVYLNGHYLPLAEAKVSVLDRGFLFGDGVYEVIPSYAGRLFRFDEHVARLNQSLSGIRLELNKTAAEWRAIFQPLLDCSKDQTVYLQVTRGPAPSRDHGFPDRVVPTVFAMCSDILPFPGRQTGVRAVTLDDTRWQMCHIKAITLLANLLLRQEAIVQDCVEAILVKNGYVTEGAASNVFIVVDDELITPPKNNDILPGITRDVIIELAAANQIPCREDVIALEALQSADEVWLTSSTREIVPVVEVDGNVIGTGEPGSIYQRIDQLFQAYKQSLA